jgi:hypothetical protein
MEQLKPRFINSRRFIGKTPTGVLISCADTLKCMPKIMQVCHLFEYFLHQQQMKSPMQAPITQFTTAKNSDQSSITQFFI